MIHDKLFIQIGSNVLSYNAYMKIDQVNKESYCMI